MSGCFSAPAATPAAVTEPGNWDAIPTGWDAVPLTDEELWHLATGFDCGPPDGNDAWVMDVDADLPFLPRDDGLGAGFAVGGATDSMPPGATLAGLASGTV